MLGRYTFFTTKAERRKLKDYLLKERKKFYPYEEALKELAQPLKTIPEDVQQWIFLKNYFPGFHWNEYQETPSDITRYMMISISESYTAKECVNSTEVGIIGALNKVFKPK